MSSFAQELPQIVVDSCIDQTRIDIEMWKRVVLPRLMRINGRVPAPQAITIKCGQTRAYPWNLEITFDSYTFKKDKISDIMYAVLTHEVAHVLTPDVVFKKADYPKIGQFAEGFAEAMTCFVYQDLHRENPSIEPCTHLFIQDSVNNVSAWVGAGTEDYYHHSTYGINAHQGFLRYSSKVKMISVLSGSLSGKRSR